MIDPSASRQAVLSRIRGPGAGTTAEAAAEKYAVIDRDYNRSGALCAEQRLNMFEERLVEYDARVHRVNQSKLPAVITAAVGERGAKRVVVPAGIPSTWLAQAAPVTEADHLSNLELSVYDGVITACTVAIALTGTIVLQTVGGQGPRRLSLIPDYHLCVVFSEQIVETVAEALDRLAATAILPTTFISGPSATADIEMTRIRGVHGPRFLDVLIVC